MVGVVGGKVEGRKSGGTSSQVRYEDEVNVDSGLPAKKVSLSREKVGPRGLVMNAVLCPGRCGGGGGGDVVVVVVGRRCFFKTPSACSSTKLIANTTLRVQA